MIITHMETNIAVATLDWIPIPKISKNNGKIDVEGIARKNSTTGSNIFIIYLEEDNSSPNSMPMIADKMKARLVWIIV